MEKKEAMKILKDFHDKSALFSVRTALDVIIPELKESEDEVIRKAIIDFFNEPGRKEYILNGFTVDDCIAWLEKQKELELSEDLGEYITELSKQFPEVSFAKLSRIAVRVKNWLEKQGKETNWKPSKEEMDVLYSLAYITNQYDEYKEEVITRLYQDLKREFFNGSSYENMFPINTSIEDDVRRRSTIQVLEYARSLNTYNQYGKADIDKNISWLEKQGEQKPYGQREECLDCQFNYAEECKGSCQMKRDEQNPTDKVEPKFKVGNWIISKYMHLVMQILNNDNGSYKTVETDGTERNDSYDFIERNFKLWTIQDAKDDDVLACDINKAEIGGDVEKLPNITPTICIYQNVVKDKDYIHSYSSLYDGSSLVLQNTMYYNYFVHNIHPATKEQRDLLFQKMKEAGYEWDSEKKELKKISQRTISAEAKEALYDKPTDEEMKELLRTEYEKGRADTIAEMKSSWSEEDEAHLMKVIWYVDNPASSVIKDTMLVEWLKSLKNRVQPKQEWSEEDKDMVENILGTYKTLEDMLDLSTEQDQDILTSMKFEKDWLKSLKQRIRE